MARGMTRGTINKFKALIQWGLALILLVTFLMLVYWAGVGLGVIPS